MHNSEFHTVRSFLNREAKYFTLFSKTTDQSTTMAMDTLLELAGLLIYSSSHLPLLV